MLRDKQMTQHKLMLMLLKLKLTQHKANMTVLLNMKAKSEKLMMLLFKNSMMHKHKLTQHKLMLIVLNNMKVKSEKFMKKLLKNIKKLLKTIMKRDLHSLKVLRKEAKLVILSLTNKEQLQLMISWANKVLQTTEEKPLIKQKMLMINLLNTEMKFVKKEIKQLLIMKLQLMITKAREKTS